ncbi:MAG: MoxR family ATPase, partial [Planctomycetota bacterium]
NTREHEISNYLRLGPLGTALLPTARPRALLIDEIDKADIDLPNDLLNIFEEGEFRIPELSRIPIETVRIREHDSDVRFPIAKGHVQCREFPFVVLTSNGEREFSPAFLRRCLRLRMNPPADLSGIIARHLGAQAAENAKEIIGEFDTMRPGKRVATDQLMNAVFMVLGRYAIDENTWESREIATNEKERLKNELLKELREFTE